MKIIDLYNKIAKDEEIPYKIKYNERIYEYAEEIKWYLRDDMKCELNNSKKCLNDEVEIIEEPKVIPEKLYQCRMDTDNNEIEFLLKNINIIIDRYNDLLDYLESKGDEVWKK